MHLTHIVGVDPGLVHTGVVRLVFDPSTASVHLGHEAVLGPDAGAVRNWIYQDNTHTGVVPHIFVEAYRPRSHFDSDAKMAKAVNDMRHAFTCTTVLNTGVKKVVKRPLMELLDVWSFPTATHHQDLRSAARIALLGMLKQETLNRLLSDVVLDHLKGRSWHVVH